MTTKVNQLQIIVDCHDAYSRGYPFEVATRYEELNSASQNELISDEWRQKLPEIEILCFLNHHRIEIETSWHDVFERLKRIIDYGGLLEYEEMMHVLTLRSELEFCKKHIKEEFQDQLDLLNQGLEETIKNNQKIQSECIVKCKNNISSFLESHWWWSNSK